MLFSILHDTLFSLRVFEEPDVQVVFITILHLY